MNLHITNNYIHCATQRIEEILRVAIFLYRDRKGTSVDSGTRAHHMYEKKILPSKTHAGVTQDLEKSDSGKAFSSLKT